MLKKEKMTFLTRFLKIYSHPAIVLWRSVEAKNLSEALNKISFDGPILDLGCGEGKVSSIIFDRTIDIGLDIDVIQVRKAKLTKSFKHLVIADSRLLPFVDEYFGLVFSNVCVRTYTQCRERSKRDFESIKKRWIFRFYGTK